MCDDDAGLRRNASEVCQPTRWPQIRQRSSDYIVTPHRMSYPILLVPMDCIPFENLSINDRMYIGSLPNENPVESGKASKQNAVAPKLTTCSKKPKLIISHVLPLLLYDYLPHECGEVYC